MNKARNNVGNIEQEYEAGTGLLNHMTSFIKGGNWNEMKVKVSDYVSVEQTDQQRKCFNPEQEYCF